MSLGLAEQNQTMVRGVGEGLGLFSSFSCEGLVLDDCFQELALVPRSPTGSKAIHEQDNFYPSPSVDFADDQVSPDLPKPGVCLE